MDNIVIYICKAYNLVGTLIDFLSNFKPSKSFLSDAIAIEAVLIGVAIPISLNVVTWAAERYKDPELADLFFEEFLYRSLFYLLMLNLITSLFLKFISSPPIWLLWITFLWTIVNIVIFYKFIRLVERYATSMDKILLKKLGKDLDALFKK